MHVKKRHVHQSKLWAGNEYAALNAIECPGASQGGIIIESLLMDASSRLRTRALILQVKAAGS